MNLTETTDANIQIMRMEESINTLRRDIKKSLEKAETIEKNIREMRNSLRRTDFNYKYDPERVIQLESCVCRYYGITSDEIRLKTRLQKIREARQILYYILRLKTRLPLAKIGDLYNQHHATVLHSVKKIGDLIEFDKAMKEDVENISALIEKDFKENYISLEL